MAQQYSHRASLSVAGMAADPHLSGGSLLGWQGVVQTAAFGGGLGDLFLVTAAGTAICALLALMLPAKPGAGGGMMVMEGAPAAPPEAAEVVAAVAAGAEPEPSATPPPRRRSTTRRAPAAPKVAAAVATPETRAS
jgi:hypothetical protein